MKKLCLYLVLIFFININNIYGIELIKKNLSFTAKKHTEITADVFSFDRKRNIFYAEGFVKIIQPGLKITADKVKYFLSKKVIVATGNVKISQAGNYILCEKIELNLKNSTGHIEKGMIYIKKRNFRISGDTIEKTSDGKYLLKNVILTSCSRRNPLWSFRCKSAEVTPDGLAKARKVKFKFSFIPYSLLYIPSATFPAKAERSSGFLLPDYDIGGKFGLRYSQAYYWAINKSSDSTFYYDLMSKRGIKLGADYRYFLTKKGKGIIKGYFLSDNGMKEDDYSIYDSVKKRYFFNVEHDQEFKKDFRIYANLNLVSDINYKDDFPEDFKKTKFFSKHSVKNDNLIKSILFLNKKIKYVNTTADFEYYKDLTKATNKYTSQKLPELSVFISQNDFAGVGFYTMLDTEYLNIYREKGDSFSRIIFQPTLSKDISLFNGSFFTETEISPTFAEYFFDVSDKSLGNESKLYLMVKNKGKMTIDKVVDFPYFGILKFKHIFEPEYEYEYITDTRHKFENFSHFDYLDNEINKNMLKYGFKQRILAKYEDSTYNELLYWELYQKMQVEKKSYFFNNRRYSNVFSDLRLNVWKNFILENKFEYDPYDYNLYKFSLLATTNFAEKSFFRYEYRYIREDVKQYNFAFNIHFLEKYDFYNYTYFDSLNSRLDRLVLGFKYSPECITLDLRVTDEQNPSNFSINFNLTLNGLGSIGNL